MTLIDRQEVAKILNVSPSRISHWIKSKHLKPYSKKDKYLFNLEEIEKFQKPRGNVKYKDKKENYFDIIDTEAKAYFLGLLWADGCNNRLTNNKCISISLIESDKDILEKLCLEIFGTLKPLRFQKSKRINEKNCYRMSIYSPHMSDKLNDYGMIPRKSMTCIFPQCIPDNLISHFIRGYFDGDGCISFAKKKKDWQFGLISSILFCEKIKEIIKFSCDIHTTLVIDKNFSSPMGRISVAGNNQVFKLLNEFIYKDATIYLERKYQKYLQLNEFIKNRDAKRTPILN